MLRLNRKVETKRNAVGSSKTKIGRNFERKTPPTTDN